MKNKFFNMFDYFLILCVLILSVTGIMFIYSSGINSDGILKTNEYIKQIIWLVIGIFAMVGFTVFDYRRFLRYIPWLFLALLLSLIYVLLFTKKVNGAHSWLKIGKVGIQPAEIGKIIFILFLGWYLDRSKKETPLKRFLFSLLIFCLPVGLIALQPDMGTASVYFAIFLFMCFFAGIPLRYLAFIVCTGVIAIFWTVLPAWNHYINHDKLAIISILTTKKYLFIVIAISAILTILSIIGYLIPPKVKYFYWIAYVLSIITFSLLLFIPASHVLGDYAIKRFISFLDPYIDPLGTGWHIINSKIAIGSGNWFGRGFKMGTQSHYQFLAEQSTDFIFGIIAEETGFIGCMMIFVVYFTIIQRIIHITKQTTNSYGTYICSGVFGMLIFHFVVNVGMVMGIMPITGIPLPFLSYGGSSLFTNMCCIGLVMSVNSRRLDFKMPI